MKKYKTYQKVLICIAPFICLAVAYIIAQLVINYISLPPCPSYMVTGLHCPGCGMTRSAIALVNGDIFLSLRQNALLIVSILIAVVFYIEFALRAFGVNFRLPFHKMRYVYIFLAMLAVYAVSRNFIPQIAPI